MLVKRDFNTGTSRCFVYLFLVIGFLTEVTANGQSIRCFLRMPYQATAYVDLSFAEEISQSEAQEKNHFRVKYDNQQRPVEVSFRLGSQAREPNHTSNRQYPSSMMQITYMEGRELRTFYDMEGKRVQVRGGVYSMRIEYAPEGWRKSLVMLDVNGELVNSSRGYARITWERLNEYQVLEKRFDQSGKEVQLRSNWPLFEVKYTFNRVGCLSEMAETGGQKRIVKYEFDSRCAQLSSTWFDKGGQPIVGPTGIHKLIRENTSEGFYQLFRFEDARGKPARYSGLYDQRKYTYDRFGNITEIRAFNLRGEPAEDSQGRYLIQYQFSDDGLILVGTRQLSLTGQEINRSN